MPFSLGHFVHNVLLMFFEKTSKFISGFSLFKILFQSVEVKASFNSLHLAL